MPMTKVRGKSSRLFALLGFALLILGMAPAIAGQGQGNGNGHGKSNGQGNSPIQSGYAIVTPVPTNANAGLVVFETFGERRGTETTQAGVLSTGLSDHWVLFTSTSGRLSRNLGVAIANPGDAEANVTLTLLDSHGSPGTPPLTEEFALATGSQVSKFVTELFSNQNLVSQDFTGTLDISSDKPVGVVGLRFRGANFSTLPATSIGATGPIPVRTDTGTGGPGAVILPQFATGGGWASEIVILNTSDIQLTVRLDLFTQEGDALEATLNGGTAHTFNATIDPGGVAVFSPGDDDF